MVKKKKEITQSKKLKKMHHTNLIWFDKNKFILLENGKVIYKQLLPSYKTYKEPIYNNYQYVHYKNTAMKIPQKFTNPIFTRESWGDHIRST